MKEAHAHVHQSTVDISTKVARTLDEQAERVLKVEASVDAVLKDTGAYGGREGCCQAEGAD